jgi:hypothetical protein
MITEDQSAQIAFLADSASYEPTSGGPAITGVERIETHGALVFLAGEHAYKMKRAVRFPYMDFSTLERRRRFCAAEIAINRRTAPTLYLEVKPIVRRADGRLAFGGDGVAVEWVVVMRRFEQADQFDRLAAAGRLTEPLVRALAQAIAAFHDGAERRDAFGGAASYTTLLAGIAAEFRRHAGAALDGASAQRWGDQARAALARCGAVVDHRRATGHVRHCHGDLHLANICLFEGRPTAFDAIEFNDDFACTDTFYDLAFLLMDLDSHGLRPLANAALNRYLELRPQDLDALATLPLFLSCRAAIRAHVAASTSATPTLASDVQSAKRAEARLYLTRALDYLTPPPARLIAIGGRSGSGKSTLARRLAPDLGAAPGAVIPRSDIIRKHLMGIGEYARLPPDGYTAAVSDRVFAEIERRAGLALAAGHCVVADAVFGTRARRGSIAALARGAGVDFAGIWLEAPAGVLESRVTQRTADASDATVEVVRRQLEGVAAPGGGEAHWHVVDGSGPPADVAARARIALGNS